LFQFPIKHQIAACRQRSALRKKWVRKKVLSVRGSAAVHIDALRKRSALLITDTELKLIASAAIIGDNS